MSAIFVAGTDTNVGKTRFCALLLDFLLKDGVKAGYQKWVATGPEFPPADLAECLRVAGQPLVPAEVARQVPYHFSLAASPHLAAEQEGKRIEAALVRSNYEEMLGRHELLVVEGVGGLMVPLRRDLLLIDLLGELAIPTLLVARSGLGTINHTLLSISALRARRLRVVGVVFSDASPVESELLAVDNMRTIAELGQVAVLGRLAHTADPAGAKKDFIPVGRAVLAAIGKAAALS
ncbi:dethiobiotin synthase [Thiovibrio sp. JS02]